METCTNQLQNNYRYLKFTMIKICATFKTWVNCPYSVIVIDPCSEGFTYPLCLEFYGMGWMTITHIPGNLTLAHMTINVDPQCFVHSSWLNSLLFPQRRVIRFLRCDKLLNLPSGKLT